MSAGGKNCRSTIPRTINFRAKWVGGGPTRLALIGIIRRGTRLVLVQSKRLRGEFAVSSGRREHFVDQLITFSVEWIDERDTLQRETILQIFGKQVPHARTPCRSP